MSREPYPTDLSDAEFACLEPYLPCPVHPGRPRIHPLREILDAIFYVVRTGCPWRLLPREFPPWQTVCHYFRLWRLNGTWEDLNDALREPLRERVGRHPQRVPGSSTASRSRRPALAGSAATTGPRSSAAASATCWSTPRGWCCGPWSTPPRSRIGLPSRCYWRARPNGSQGCGTSGWTRATPAAGAGGSNISSAGRSRWSSSHRSRVASGSRWVRAKTRARARGAAFQRSGPASVGCCLGGGAWSGASPGSARAAASARTTSGSARPARR
jgi:transposase